MGSQHICFYQSQIESVKGEMTAHVTDVEVHILSFVRIICPVSSCNTTFDSIVMWGCVIMAPVICWNVSFFLRCEFEFTINFCEPHYIVHVQNVQPSPPK